MPESHIIEDEHLHALLAEAEANYAEEMTRRRPEWPSCAALAYWHMIQTLHRFLTLPHHP